MWSKEQVKILKSGVAAWNAWRNEHPDVRPDLSGANLTRANLRGANLNGADLTYANLGHAVLTNLKGANLRGANIVDTVFANVDLSQAKGLETAKHRGPSPISTSTLQRSHGQTPEVFLKGCGLSDWEIQGAKLYNPELTEDERTVILYEISRLQGEQPINFHRVFISYTRKDEPFVEAIEKRLDEKGVRCWWDVHDMKAGRLERQIDRAIDLNPLVLLVLSERSVESDWVEWEASRARDLEKRLKREGTPRDVLCPVALDDAWKNCDWPGYLRQQIEDYNILDFSGWEDDKHLAEQFGKLYDGLVLHY